MFVYQQGCASLNRVNPGLVVSRSRLKVKYTQGHVVSTARDRQIQFGNNEQGDYNIVGIFMLRNAKPAADMPAVKQTICSDD